jgi:hypothetical protein
MSFLVRAVQVPTEWQWIKMVATAASRRGALIEGGARGGIWAR